MPPTEFIRVLFHLDNEKDYNCFLFLPGQQALPTKKNPDGIVDAYLEPDQDAFGSGVVARDLLTNEGMQRLRRHLATAGKRPSAFVNVEFRTGNMSIAFPAHVVKDISANRWQDVA